MTKGINYLWQADLLVFTNIAAQNDGYKYICCVIDTFSKKLWTFPLKNKTGSALIKALSRHLLMNRPSKLQVDQGTEFLNSKFSRMMDAYGINLYNTYSKEKAAIVERVQRTLRNRLGKIWEQNRNKRWIDVLPQITESYNNSFHRSIGMKPNDVTLENSRLVMSRLFPKPTPSDRNYTKYLRKRARQNRRAAKYKKNIKVGDLVRVLAPRPHFRKETDISYTDATFRVRYIRDPKLDYGNYDNEPVTFLLEDLHGSPILGTYYYNELQKVL